MFVYKFSAARQIFFPNYVKSSVFMKFYPDKNRRRKITEHLKKQKKTKKKKKPEKKKKQKKKNEILKMGRSLFLR